MLRVILVSFLLSFLAIFLYFFFFLHIVPQSISYASMILNKVGSKLFFFFFKERSLDKTQPWLQLEAAGISVPCFSAWPLS